MSMIGNESALNEEQIDYEGIKRRLLFAVNALAGEVMLFDNSGCIPWTTTGLVSNTPIVQVYSSLDCYFVVAPVTGVSHFTVSCADSHWQCITASAHAPSTLRDRFIHLRDLWLNETSHISRLDQVYLHPAYQQIIGMGKDALPFIFNEIKQPRGRWFWALRAITGNEPFKGQRGIRHDMMVNEWLEWGKANGYS